MCVCVTQKLSIEKSTNCLKRYTVNLGHLASRTVVSVTSRNPEPEDGKEVEEGKTPVNTQK